MNPAALATNLGDLEPGGILIVNEDAFEEKDLEQAGYEQNPLEDGSSGSVPAVPSADDQAHARCRRGAGAGREGSRPLPQLLRDGPGLLALRPRCEPTLRYIDEKFGKKPEVAEANRRALQAGYNYGETTEAFVSSYRVEPAKLPPGKYRNIMGNQALAWGLMAAAKLSGKELFLGAYPITPASDILHDLCKYKNFGVRTFQAEDEIAAITSAIGAAFGGAMAVTASSGPGIALKGEAMGLAVMTELPLLIINVQRGGPSTGLPTKTEQADLLQAMFGRNGECPMPVIAARSPADCFDVAQEAWRIAVRFMTPVMVLTDGYIANGSRAVADSGCQQVAAR